MEILHGILSDFHKGKNISLYVTIFFAVLFAILNLFGALQQPYMDSLTLAVLALLVNALLTNRNMLERIYQPRRGLVESGIFDAYGNLPLDMLDEQFRKANTEICILQTYISNANAMPPGLIDAARRGIPIKLLFLDLHSDILKQRLEDAGFNRDSTRAQTGLETIRGEITKFRLNDSKLEIRFYDALPPFSLYAIDDLMLFGLYWHGCETTRRSFIEVRGRTTKFGASLLDTFDQLWNSANKVNSSS